MFNYCFEGCDLTQCHCRFGSAELKKEFLLPSIMGDKVACLGVSEVGAGSDVASKYIFPPKEKRQQGINMASHETQT